jgi:hypothetical protein
MTPHQQEAPPILIPNLTESQQLQMQNLMHTIRVQYPHVPEQVAQTICGLYLTDRKSYNNAVKGIVQTEVDRARHGSEQEIINMRIIDESSSEYEKIKTQIIEEQKRHADESAKREGREGASSWSFSTQPPGEHQAGVPSALESDVQDDSQV